MKSSLVNKSGNTRNVPSAGNMFPAGPLINISPNLPTRTPAKLDSPLVRAKETIDLFCAKKSTTNYASLSVAFEILYANVKVHEELISTVKKHQHYVVFLNSKMLHEFALEELSVIYNVICSSSRSRSLPYTTLLKGISSDTHFPIPLLVSFHFFVLQSMLQMMSFRVKSIMKITSKEKSLFWNVALSFTKGSNFEVCVTQSEQNLTPKYNSNALKIIIGFTKLAVYVARKTSTSELDTAVSALELKAAQYQLLVNEGTEIRLPTIHGALLKPFVSELLDTFTKLKNSANSSTWSNSNELCYRILGTYLETHTPTLVESNSELYVGNSTSIEGSDLRPTNSAISLIEVSESAISSLVDKLTLMRNKPVEIKITQVIQDCVSYLKRTTSERVVFEFSLHEFVPLLSSIILEAGLAQNAQALSRLCLEFAEVYESPLAFQMVCQIDLNILSLREPIHCRNHIIDRIEHCLGRLFDLKFDANALSLIEIYVSSSVIHTHAQGFPELVSSCILYDNTKIALFFGNESYLEPALQTKLFKNILQPLRKKLSGPGDRLIENLLSCQLHAISVETQYMISSLFHVDMNINLLASSTTCSASDHIFTAGILMNKKRHKFNIDVLRRVEELVAEWLAAVSMPNLTKHFGVFLDIVISLADMGFQYQSILLIELLKKSEFDDPQGLLDAELILCHSLLESSDLKRLPVVLKNCGVLFKNNFRHLSERQDKLIELKLKHLEYYIKSRDEIKSRAKCQEVEAILTSRSDFILGSAATDISVEIRLEHFVSIAKFSYLTSMVELMSCNVLSALGNLKLSMKLLNSVLRKVSGTQLLENLERKALLVLLACVQSAFLAAKHLGISKEAIHYMREFTKLNSLMLESPLKTYYHFVSANFLKTANKQEEAVEQFSIGCERNWASPSIKLVQFATGALLGSDPKPSSHVISLQKHLQVLLLEVKEAGMSCVPPISVCQTSNVLLEVEFLIASTPRICYHIFELDDLDIFQMLTRAVTMAVSKLFEAFASFGDMEEFGSSVAYLPNENLSNCESREISQTMTALIACRDLLLRFQVKTPRQYPDVSIMNYASALMGRCVFFLFDQGLFKDERSKALLDCSMSFKDLASTLPYSNQRDILLNGSPLESPKLLPQLCAPSLSEVISEPSGYASEDLKKILPESWVVVTLDICPFSGDLIMTRLGSHNENSVTFKVPFDRLELKRRRFCEYLDELKLIIAKSNHSTKNETTANIKTKEERRSWWRLRFELDSNLETLLNTIEISTIAGLLGIFASIGSGTESYRTFESELNSIWNSTIGAHSGLFKLEMMSVHLFYSILSTEIDEPTKLKLLEDLTEIILKGQVCPERSGHLASVKESIVREVSKLYVGKTSRGKHEHLILIPSQSCTLIPWESMKCLRNRSVSRMPSVSFLADSLQRHKNRMVIQEGRAKGFLYVLNPGSDLVKTQDRFEPIFDKTKGAVGLSGRRPTEDWLLSNLYKTSLYIYLGHGGGEQYLRSSSLFKSQSVKRQNLPVALLLGCSSLAHQEHGKLQPSSNAFDWLVCGSPAVMANLWDITDKDIDIFSLSLFTEWGLFDSESHTSMSLSQAMIQSRSKCTLKFLNGAAPVLYGLPLLFRNLESEFRD